MKKIALGLMTLALTVALSLSAMAGTPEHSIVPLPANAVELEAWELVGGSWVPMGGPGLLTANARAWRSGVKSGICNKIYWDVPVKVHASVAQWVEFSLSGTRWDWRVRKPGTYATDCITASLKSNGDLELDFAGFGNLVGAGGVIPIWYAYDSTLPAPVDARWVPAVDLDAMDALIPDCVELHEGFSWKLWNKIEVADCDSACEYTDDAQITLVLKNQKDWIDPTSGDFLP